LDKKNTLNIDIPSRKIEELTQEDRQILGRWVKFLINREYIEKNKLFTYNKTHNIKVLKLFYDEFNENNMTINNLDYNELAKLQIEELKS